MRWSLSASVNSRRAARAPCALLAMLPALVSCSDRPTEPLHRGGVPGQVLSRSTVLVRPNAGDLRLVSQSDSTLVLVGPSGDIKTGTVILSTVGKGALRKVTSVSSAGGNTVLTTTQASLAEAFDSLHVDDSLTFSRANIGEIQSGVPGLGFSWVPDDSATGVAAMSSPDITYNKFKISFAGFSVSKQQGISLSGTATFRMKSTPFNLYVDRAPGRLLPSVSQFVVGMQAETSDDIRLTSRYGGSLAYEKAFFDYDVGPPIPIGYLVFQPHLKVSSRLTGTASGGLSHRQVTAVNAYGVVKYDRSTGWSTSRKVSVDMKASEDLGEAAFDVEARPVAVELSFNLYDVAGPYGTLFPQIKATGRHDVINQVEGIDARVVAGIGGEVGLRASTPKAFSKLFEASWTPVSVSFTMVPTELFHTFFPYAGVASIIVGDNGPAADDVFAVAVDGTLLGQTDKGGTGSFRVTSLIPGAHTLTITCLDDGANGNDIGTLGVLLNNGYAFADGSRVLSDLLFLNQTKHYTIIAPAASPLIAVQPLTALPPGHVREGRDRLR